MHDRLVVQLPAFAVLLLAALLVFGIHYAIASAPTEGLDIEMIEVPAGTFIMGRDEGDPATFTNELPRHAVTLDTYKIGKFKLTVREYLILLNWALDQGLLLNGESEPWDDNGDIYIDYGDFQRIIWFIVPSQMPFTYDGNDFQIAVRDSDLGTTVSMENYPMYFVNWYGAAAACNWLSTIEGLSPAYDLSTWKLIDADPITDGHQFTNGYRLPTEAEWERAAGWNGTAHVRYGNNSMDVNATGATYADSNPMGLSIPKISPVGFYNGKNIIPRTGLQTTYSASPIGAFDMCGNLYEWCHDWMQQDYYSVSPEKNPLGPATNVEVSNKVTRGGSWNVPKPLVRSAFRFNQSVSFSSNYIGIRLARSGPDGDFWFVH